MPERQAIPIEPEEFTAPLVQRLINTKHPDVVVERVRVVDAALAGDGEERVSTARRIAVEADYGAGGERLPRRLMIKVARPGLGDIPLYDNEVNVYAKVGDELPVNTPRCLGALRDAATPASAWCCKICGPWVFRSPPSRPRSDRRG